MRPAKAHEVPWPTPEQLERMGAVRCQEDGCTTWINPAERRRGRCLSHERRHAQRRRQRAHQRDERPTA